MTPERQQKIDKVSKISENVMLFGFVVILMGGFILLKVGIVILNRFGINVYEWDSYETAKQIYITFNWIVAGISTLAFFAHISIREWATDDEKEQRKNEIKEALQEIKAEEASKPKRTIFTPEEIKIPLKGLTPQQVAVVHNILQHIPEQNGHLKTSELVQILRALKGQGDLDDSNMQQVIAWVEYITEEKVDERNFKYDYESKYSDKGVVKWGDIIRAEFDKIEIS